MVAVTAAPGPVAAVEPDLRELIELRRLAARAVAPDRGGSAQSAQAVSPQRGRGMDYAESRPYSPGDDARHIDWRVTARTGRAHSKIFHAERERVSLILADTASALYFGTRQRFKSVQAARAGALATWLALRAGDRPGALRSTHAERPIAPKGGTRGALPVLEALARWYRRPPEEDLGLGEGIKAARRLLHPGASLLILADPRSFDRVEDAAIAALSAHCELRVVLLVDPFELDPPSARLRFVAGAGALSLDLRDAQARAHWQAQFGDRLLSTEQRLRRLRARVLILRSDEPTEAVLRLFPRRAGRAA